MAGTKSRQFAVICSVIMVLTAIYVGGLRSLNKLYNNAADVFYSGTDTMLSVSEIFDKEIATSRNLISLSTTDRNGVVYISEDNPDLQALKKATDLLEETYSRSEMAEANEEMQRAFNAVASQLKQADMSDTDVTYLTSLTGQMSSREQQLAAVTEQYNELATTYNDALKRIPMNILSKIYNMRSLELL